MARGVLITGAAKRLGAAMAEHLAGAGFDIALHYNESEADAKALQQRLRSAGRACELFRHDVTDIAGIPALMTAVKTAMPQVDTLINNASVFERGDFLGTDEALFDRQFNVNLKAPFFVIQAFAKTFGQGNVVNMLDCDITQNKNTHFAYLLSKKAHAELTEMAAVALGPDVRVNGVCPGLVISSDEDEDHYEQKLTNINPLKSIADVEDVCRAVEWLLQPSSTTGQLLFVDGGRNLL